MLELLIKSLKIFNKFITINENKYLFYTKYMPYLPTEDELINEIERQKELLKIQFYSDKIIQILYKKRNKNFINILKNEIFQ